MWFARLPLVLACICWSIVVRAQDAPTTGKTVTAPEGVAVGRDVINSPITINFGLAPERFKEVVRQVILEGKTDKHIPAIPSRGAIACYSHFEAGSNYSVGKDIYVMGIVSDLAGRYIGRIFQPAGYEGKDISGEQTFKDLCNARFPSCKNGCWAGGDTGGFFGYK